MKKLMMIGLIAVTPFMATPSHSISPEAVKLVLAGAGHIGSAPYFIHDNNNFLQTLPLFALHLGSFIALIDLQSSDSTLIQGISKTILGYVSLAAQAKKLKTDSWGVIGAICASIMAAIGTKEIIDGIAEKFESKPHAIDLPVEQEEQEVTFTDLHSAVIAGSYTQVARLLEEGANVDMRICDSSLLHIAALHIHSDIVRLLLQYGAPINARNFVKATPLHVATICGNLEIVKIFVEYGADTTLKDDEGQTPYDLAIKYGYTEIAQLLAEHEKNSK